MLLFAEVLTSVRDSIHTMLVAPAVRAIISVCYNSPLNAAPSKPFFKPSSSNSFFW